MNTEKTRAELGSKALLASVLADHPLPWKFEKETYKWEMYVSDANGDSVFYGNINGGIEAKNDDTLLMLEMAINQYVDANAPADLPATAGMVRRDVGCCGKCAHFDSEDISGSGWCSAADHATACGDHCLDYHDNFFTPNEKVEAER